MIIALLVDCTKLNWSAGITWLMNVLVKTLHIIFPSGGHRCTPPGELIADLFYIQARGAATPVFSPILSQFDQIPLTNIAKTQILCVILVASGPLNAYIKFHPD